MEFFPPISQRATNELLDVISDDEQWVKEARKEAKEELVRREYTEEAIEAERQKRMNELAKNRKRRSDILEINARKGYRPAEMLLLPLFLPLSLILDGNPLDDFLELSEKKYRKKIWQLVMFWILSLLLWFQIFRLLL